MYRGRNFTVVYKGSKPSVPVIDIHCPAALVSGAIQGIDKSKSQGHECALRCTSPNCTNVLEACYADVRCTHICFADIHSSNAVGSFGGKRSSGRHSTITNLNGYYSNAKKYSKTSSNKEFYNVGVRKHVLEGTLSSISGNGSGKPNAIDQHISHQKSEAASRWKRKLQTYSGSVTTTPAQSNQTVKLPSSNWKSRLSNTTRSSYSTSYPRSSAGYFSTSGMTGALARLKHALTNKEISDRKKPIGS